MALSPFEYYKGNINKKIFKLTQGLNLITSMNYIDPLFSICHFEIELEVQEHTAKKEN